MYDAPMLAIREGRVIHLADRTAVRAHLTELMAAYARSGAARADIAYPIELTVTLDGPLGDRLVTETHDQRGDVPRMSCDDLKDF